MLEKITPLTSSDKEGKSVEDIYKKQLKRTLITTTFLILMVIIILTVLFFSRELKKENQKPTFNHTNIELRKISDGNTTSNYIKAVYYCNRMSSYFYNDRTVNHTSLISLISTDVDEDNCTRTVTISFKQKAKDLSKLFFFNSENLISVDFTH